MQIWQNESMKCPNCQATLSPEKIGSTVYWRCQECGAFWFDNKESDFLTEEEAKKLAELKPQPSFSNLNYRCPKDKKKLKYDGLYYRCYSCGGLMASASNIVTEKKDKNQRFSANLNKPISFAQMKQVVIFASVALFIAINFGLINGLRHRLTSNTQAQAIQTNLQIRNLGEDKLALYFTTEEPYRSSAHFVSDQKQWDQVVSQEYTLNHFLIVAKPNKATTVQIKLQDLDNKEHLTKAIELKP